MRAVQLGQRDEPRPGDAHHEPTVRRPSLVPSCPSPSRSCQILLADLWLGGMQLRSNANLKVLAGLFFPPSIFLLHFKSREQLLLQPQTAAEHDEDLVASSSSSSEDESFYELDTSSEEDEETGARSHAPSVMNLNVPQLLNQRSKRKSVFAEGKEGALQMMSAAFGGHGELRRKKRDYSSPI